MIHTLTQQNTFHNKTFIQKMCFLLGRYYTFIFINLNNKYLNNNLI